jgi:hypothetical protein
MRTTWIALSVMLSAACGRAAADDGTRAGDALLPPRQAVQGVAVVELFTSQGCSSCPPAEQVLADLTAAAARSGEPVYCLGFHVDYWNHLGWVDPFSSPAFSDRQSQYARAYHADQVYTPQMIVNGTTQFTGSDRSATRQALGDALGRRSPAGITLTADRSASGAGSISYAVTGGPGNAVVNLAVIEQGLSSHVERGENAGRVLQQADVVRWFSTKKLAGDRHGQVSLPTLADVDLNHATVVAYVQLPDDMQVLGAAAAEFRLLRK